MATLRTRTSTVRSAFEFVLPELGDVVSYPQLTAVTHVVSLARRCNSTRPDGGSHTRASAIIRVPDYANTHVACRGSTARSSMFHSWTKTPQTNVSSQPMESTQRSATRVAS